MKVTRENLSDGTIGHLVSVLLTRERFTLTRVDGKEREAKRRGEVTYQALERTCSGEKGESKRERGREVKIERGGVAGGGRTIRGRGRLREGWAVQVSCLLSSCRPGYRLRMSRDRAIRLRSTTREDVLATVAHRLPMSRAINLV